MSLYYKKTVLYFLCNIKKLTPGIHDLPYVFFIELFSLFVRRNNCTYLIIINIHTLFTNNLTSKCYLPKQCTIKQINGI